MDSLGVGVLPSQFEIVPADGSLYLHFIACFVTLALMLLSLSAIPADSYITPNWLSSIPHM